MSKTENMIEESFCKTVKNFGGIPYKFTSPGCVGVPDRLVLFPVPPEHQMIVSNYIWFAELKAPGKKPRANQKREHKRLHDMGFIVKVLDE